MKHYTRDRRCYLADIDLVGSDWGMPDERPQYAAVRLMRVLTTTPGPVTFAPPRMVEAPPF